jgi:hypothetical protein
MDDTEVHEIAVMCEMVNIPDNLIREKICPELKTGVSIE